MPNLTKSGSTCKTKDPLLQAFYDIPTELWKKGEQRLQVNVAFLTVKIVIKARERTENNVKCSGGCRNIHRCQAQFCTETAMHKNITHNIYWYCQQCLLFQMDCVWNAKKGKGKSEHLYSVQTTLKRSGMDHTAFNLQRTPCLPLPRKCSPDGVSTECGAEHLIAAHYSFIDRERMKGWVGLIGWPIADGLPT